MKNTDYQMEIFCSLQIDGVHRWDDCPIEEMEFLKNDHRHMFNIKAYKTVYHDDRDVEFIQFKHEILDFLKGKYYNPSFRSHYFGGKSCEMLAVELIDHFDLLKCEVSEDGENGAIVTKNQP